MWILAIGFVLLCVACVGSVVWFATATNKEINSPGNDEWD